MNASTFSDMGAPLMALRAAAGEFPHLPAPSVHLSTIFPERLELSFHYGFAAFEAWREALGFDPAGVVHDVQGGGKTGVLTVHGAFAGAAVRLVGYAEVPAVAEERSRAEVPA